MHSAHRCIRHSFFFFIVLDTRHMCLYGIHTKCKLEKLIVAQLKSNRFICMFFFYRSNNNNEDMHCIGFVANRNKKNCTNVIVTRGSRSYKIQTHLYFRKELNFKYWYNPISIAYQSSILFRHLVSIHIQYLKCTHTYKIKCIPIRWITITTTKNKTETINEMYQYQHNGIGATQAQKKAYLI